MKKSQTRNFGNTILDCIPVGRDDERVEVDGGSGARHDAHLLRDDLLGGLASEAQYHVLLF